LRVRTMEARDIEKVLEIQRGCPEIAQWSARDYERVVSGEMAGWTSEDERGVAGFLVARELVGETEVLNFAVRADVRRQGLGSMLVDAAVDWSRGLGAERVMLEVRASNEAAVRFYDRHGFVEAGRRAKYYVGPVEDAFVLMRRLEKGPLV
jgi:[ribosomal protein S18]-alanine N-acetyltransferase